MKLLFATHNPNKILEIKPKLPSGFRLTSLEELKFLNEVPETGNTLEENALEKARYIYNRFKIIVMADDTGLEVEALNNEPGVFSARYAGDQKNSEDNINKLLGKLSGIANRKARFRTVISLITATEEINFEGIVEGVIIHERRGNGGFGYDPVFIPDGHDKTFAEMSLEEKNQISHRARAINKLTEYLDQKY